MTMRPDSGADRARWDALIDREALGEVVFDPDDSSFIHRYEAEHPELAHERSLFAAAIASLREQVEDADDPDVVGVDDELTLAREAAAALQRYRSEPAAPAPELAHGVDPAASLANPPSTTSSASRRWWIAGLAVAAAGLAVWIGVRETKPPTTIGADTKAPSERDTRGTQPPSQLRTPIDPSPVPGAPVDPVARLSMVDVNIGSNVELGQTIAPGQTSAQLLGSAVIDRACISWSAPTAVVCFEGEVSVLPGTESGQRRLRLESGRLVAALDPLGPGQRFTVETVVGTVSAIGTVFAVENHEGREWVTVLEGRVELRDPMVRVLTAGRRTSLRGEVPGDEPTPLAADTIPSALAQLVGLAELLRASPGQARLHIPVLGEQRLFLDGHVIDGPATLSLAAGAHTLRSTDADDLSLVEQSIDLDDEAPFNLGELLTATLDPAEDKPSMRKTPSAKQLAEAAQRERMARDYKETARLYRELLDRYPDSPEAANVPVRLGDLLITIGDHSGALEAYELYLERGARQLAPEAEYGRIRTLRALGHTADERAAIQAFIAARPDDYRSTELASRLAELDG